MLNPYPGLRPFASRDKRFFFGRETSVDELLERLESHRFVAVIGVSGSGKSSLVNAGLVPMLERQSIQEKQAPWRIITFRPGSAPLDSFSAALRKPLEESPAALVSFASSCLGKEGTRYAERLLLIVDQFEEIFTYNEAVNDGWSTEAETKREEDFRPVNELVEMLIYAVEQRATPVYVLITMRSDYLGDCSRFRNFPELLNRTQYLIPRMTLNELRDAIDLPAALGEPAAELDPRVTNRLLNDVNDDPRNLPRLQHVLMCMWRNWQLGNTATPVLIGDYRTVGEFGFALNKHAEEVYGQLPPNEKLLAEVIFKRITKRDASGRMVRSAATLEEVYSITKATGSLDGRRAVDSVLLKFMADDVSFLVPVKLELTSEMSANEMIPPVPVRIDITHESLITGWTKLTGWVTRESESAQEYRRVRDAQKRGWMFRGSALSNVLTEYIGKDFAHPDKWTREWSVRYSDSGDVANQTYETVLAFLMKSVEDQKQDDQKEKDRKWNEYRLKQQRKFNRLLGGLTGLVILLGLLSFAMFWIEWREGVANQIAKTSRSLSSFTGAYWRERAALVQIESYNRAKNVETQDVADWENFESIAPATIVGSVEKASGITPMAPMAGGLVAIWRLAAWNADTPAHLPLTFLSLASERKTEEIWNSKKIAAVTDDGRYAVTSCQNSIENLLRATGASDEKPTKIPCEKTPIEWIADYVDPAGRAPMVAVIQETEEGQITIVPIEDDAPGPLVPRQAFTPSRSDRPANDIVRRLSSVRLGPDHIVCYQYHDYNRGNPEARNGGIKIVDLDKKSELKPILTAPGQTGFEFAKDFLYFVDGSGKLSRWQAGSTQLLETLETHPVPLSGVTSFKLSHGGEYLAVAEGSAIRMFGFPELPSNPTLKPPKSIPASTAIELPELWTKQQGGAQVNGLQFTSDDRLLGLALGDGTARIWDTKTGFETAEAPHDLKKPALAIAFFSDTHGKEQALSVGGDGKIQSFDLDRAKTKEKVKFDECTNPQKATWSDDGATLSAICSDAQGATFFGMVWKLSTDVTTRVTTASVLSKTTYLERSDLRTNCDVSVNGGEPAAAWTCGGSIRVWRTGDSNPELLPTLGNSLVTSVALGSDGLTVAAGHGLDGKVSIFKYDLKSKKWLLQKETFPWPRDKNQNSGNLVTSDLVTSLAFSGRPKEAPRLAIGTSNGDIYVETYADGFKQFRPVEHVGETIDTLQYSSSGDQLAFGSSEFAGVMHLKDHSRPIKVFHKTPISDVAFSPDESSVASLDKNGLVQVWAASRFYGGAWDLLDRLKQLLENPENRDASARFSSGEPGYGVRFADDKTFQVATASLSGMTADDNPGARPLAISEHSLDVPAAKSKICNAINKNLSPADFHLYVGSGRGNTCESKENLPSVHPVQ